MGNQAQAQQIPVPVPGVGERRPYHALVRENAEACIEWAVNQGSSYFNSATPKYNGTYEPADKASFKQLAS